MKHSSKLKGFTLIEVLITIVILAILAGITIVALNPGQNIDDANDVKRKADVNGILNAVWQYAIDNDGDFPGDIGETSTAISSDGANICSDLVPKYLSRIPGDPTNGSYSDCTTYSSGYAISKDSDGKHVTITATLSDSSTHTQSR